MQVFSLDKIKKIQRWLSYFQSSKVRTLSNEWCRNGPNTEPCGTLQFRILPRHRSELLDTGRIHAKDNGTRKTTLNVHHSQKI